LLSAEFFFHVDALSYSVHFATSQVLAQTTSRFSDGVPESEPHVWRRSDKANTQRVEGAALWSFLQGKNRQTSCSGCRLLTKNDV
jgi:hypothetical protein